MAYVIWAESLVMFVYYCVLFIIKILKTLGMHVIRWHGSDVKNHITVTIKHLE